MGSGIPPALATSGLALGLDAFVATTACVRAGVADARASFELTFDWPDDRHAFFVFAGLEPLIDALERLRWKPDDLSWLESVSAIDEPTRRRIESSRFLCDIDAAPEGSIVFAREPVLTLEGPFWQAQLAAGLVVGALADATLTATRFARFATATNGARLVEDGAAIARRLGGTPLLARAAYVGGAHARTSAAAARRYRLPTASIQPLPSLGAHPRAVDAYAWWLASTTHAMLRTDPRAPRACIEALVEAAAHRDARGVREWTDEPIAVVIPARGAPELAREITRAFDGRRLRAPTILVEGITTESAAAELARETKSVAGVCLPGHAAVDGGFARYDLVAIDDEGSWSPRGHSPGRKVVLRYVDAEQRPVADVVHLAHERHLRAKSDARFVDRDSEELTSLRGTAQSAPLLMQAMRQGRRVAAPEPADRIRARALSALAALPAQHKRIEAPARYTIGLTPAARALSPSGS